MHSSLKRTLICGACSFCLQPESLLHIVAGCKMYLHLGRFSWRHYSVLRFVAQTFQSINSFKFYVDLPGYLSPYIITGDSLRPDMLLSTADNCLYIIKLIMDFETNLNNNTRRKELKYRSLLTDLSNDYHTIEFVNLSMSCLGIFGHSSDCSKCSLNQASIIIISISLSPSYLLTNHGVTPNFSVIEHKNYYC